MLSPLSVALAAAMAMAQGINAQEANPSAVAPPSEAQPLCTDRPTKSSNACTVDAGRFQLETDLFNGTFQRLRGVTTDTYLVTNPTLKYGLSKTLDVEVNVAPYEIVRTHDTSQSSDTTVSGIGDLYLRLKYGVYTSKSGAVQIGLFPYLKAPTAKSGLGNGAVEGGLVVPVNIKLNDTWAVGFAPELDTLLDSAGSGRHSNMIQTVNVGYSLPHDVTLYGELWGDWNYDPAGSTKQFSADVAVGWAATKTLQLDCGLNLGLNRNTPGLQAYIGVSKRY